MTTTPRGPLSSVVPPESTIVGGVYNAVPPAPLDEQPCALQLDAQGRLLVSSTGGGGGGNVDIFDSSGNVLNSNGAGALNVAVVSGGGSNPSVGLTGAAAPTSATEIGVVVAGNLQNVSSTNPMFVQGPAAADAAASGNPVLIGGVDAAGNIQELPVADSGSSVPVQVVNIGGSNPTGKVSNLFVDTDGSISTGVGAAATDASANNTLTLVDATGGSFKLLVASTLFNGTTWDRQRSAGSIGVAAVGGAAAIDAAASGNPVTIAGIDAAGNVQELPVANSDTTVLTTVLQVGGSVTTAAPTYTTGRTDPLSLDTAGNLRVLTSPAAGTTTAVVGTLTNNNAAPAATNVGALTALANAANPSWTEGDQVLISVDLSGHQRVVTTGAAAADAAQSGNPVLVAGVDNAGNVQELPIVDTGAAVTAQTVLVGGTDGTNARQLLTDTSGRQVVIGSKTNNNVAPDGSNIGVLPALANAASPTWTEGDLVTESVDLTGRQRIRGTLTNNNAAPAADGTMTLSALANAAAPTWTEGDVVLLSEDLSGRLRVLTTPAAGAVTTVAGNLTNNNAAPAATEVGVLPALANAVSPTWTEGDQVLESVDLHGGQRTIGGNIPEVTAAWTSATTLNTTLQINTLGYGAVLVTFNFTGSTGTGVFSFEGSDTTAFTNAYSVTGLKEGSTSATTVLGLIQSVVTNASVQNISFLIDAAGWAAIRVRLSTVITGANTANIGMAAIAASTPLAVSGIAGTVSATSLNAQTVFADNKLNVDFFTDTNGNNNGLPVADTVYGGAFSGAADAARQGWSKRRAPTVFKTAQATASGNTAVWTPGTGNKFRLLKIFVELTDNASLAAGAVLTIDIRDSNTTTSITFDVFVPTTAVTTAVGDGLEQELDLGDFGILSAAANNVLNVNLSATLATGNVRIITMGTEE